MYLYLFMTAKFVERNENFKPELLTKEEWREHYRKGRLSKKNPNVQANIMLLSFYVMPLICLYYRKWGSNKTEQPMSDRVLVNLEAWVLLMVVQ